MKDYIAIDLGASNGRAILGRFDGSKLTLEEINRFETHFMRVLDACHWDVLSLYAHIGEALGLYAKNVDGMLSGIGIDTWGVDFGLIDKQGRLIGNPRAYRDLRGRRGMQAFHKKYGNRKLYDITGIANLEFNTAYQLYDMMSSGDPQLEIADKLLLMPDLLGYMLSGAVSSEYTNATTTQMLDWRTGSWSQEICSLLGVPSSLLSPVQMSGERKGHLKDAILKDTGLKGAPPIYCVGSHDTASAVASVPAASDNYAFISSGTWSLMGFVSDQPVISNDAFALGFSNEGTVEGKYRPLRNIMGLWVIQSCKRQWDKQQKLTWREIDNMVDNAPAFGSFVDVNNLMFFDGDNMPQKIQQYCADTGQNVPQTIGEIARTIYESLAMSYKETFVHLEKLKGSCIDVLHIVGGGSNNLLLNQMTSDAICRTVIAGPSEATAIGNLMMQVKASGEVSDMDQVRQVIRDSFDVEIYEPKNKEAWAEQFDRYQKIISKMRGKAPNGEAQK